MRNALTIARREILSFFVSPVAYFVITGFVLLAGYFFFQYLVRFNMILNYVNSMPYRGAMNTPNLNQYVVEVFYQTLVLIMVFLIPVLTMRLIAEERKNGTFELLATSPVSVSEIVWGKFLGVSVVIIAMTLLAFIFPLMLCIFGNPEVAPILSGYLAILLCGLAFASIGMAASSFTENQIVAAITGTVALLLLYVSYSPGSAEGSWADLILKRLSPLMQLDDLVKGVVTIQSCVYFLSLITLGIFVSKRALDAQRWR